LRDFEKAASVFPLRRQVLKLFGGAALAGLQATRLPLWAEEAVPSPSLTEGPYFVDEDLNRRDLRVDPTDGTVQPGYPLSLSVRVAQLKDGAEAPLTGAYVDIWHCNASGDYSDIGATAGKKYLRGYQATDRHGTAYFLTVYPGWYAGRAVHIHVKVRIFNGNEEAYEFTSQFFFDDAFSDEIFKLSPYTTHGLRDTLNTTDSIYGGASSIGVITSNSGSYLLLSLRKKEGWVEADAKLICDLSLGSSPDQTPGGMPGGPGGPGGPGPGMPPPGTPPGPPSV
jgi:protocatechuate 3,4-dioxygenase beta subunit